MPTFLAALAVFLLVARTALFAVAVVLAVVCLLDWLVRTRRISPFGPLARFFRARVDPLMMPIERRVVSAGGMPTSAPWWALAAVVIGGILLITLLGFLRGWIGGVVYAVSAGPRGVFVLLVSLTFGLLQVALLVRVLSSWFRISPYSAWVRWSFVLTEPILAPLRRVIPPFGMMDVTPIVAYFLLRIFASLLLSQL